MPRWIDADALLKMICELCVGECKTEDKDSCAEWDLTNSAINRIDTKPMKHGKWLDADDEIDWKCSLCGAEQWANSPFCPHCGAKMDLK